MTFEIPWIPPSNNTLLRRAAHVRWKQQTKQTIACYIVVQVGKPHERETCRVRLSITVFRGRLLDPDNFVGGLKFLIDALVRLGWLRDDSSEWLDLVPPMQVLAQGGYQRTRIVIETLEEKC